MNPLHWLLGVDSGGSKTTAWLSRASVEAKDVPLEATAFGSAGPTNVERDPLGALAAIEQAIHAAFQHAGHARSTVDAACIALAGAGDASVRDRVRAWAQERDVAKRLVVVHDAVPVLACAEPAGDALALLSGTGSMSFGHDARGRTARAGGWGAFLGDEGSAFAIARAALREVVRAEDRRAPRSELRELLFAELEIDEARELLRWCRLGERVADIAALSVLVDRAADRGDDVAREVLHRAGEELAGLAMSVAHRLGFEQQSYALCVAGSTLLGSQTLRDSTARALSAAGLEPKTCLRVVEPVLGCIRIARRATRGEFHRPDESLATWWV